jgi:hypothetical protein
VQLPNTEFTSSGQNGCTETLTSFVNDALNTAANGNIDVNNYDNILYFIAAGSQCDFLGLGTLGGAPPHYSWYTVDGQPPFDGTVGSCLPACPACLLLRLLLCLLLSPPSFSLLAALTLAPLLPFTLCLSQAWMAWCTRWATTSASGTPVPT